MKCIVQSGATPIPVLIQAASLSLVEEVLDKLFKFKGADWVGMIFGLIATFKLAKERRSGFIYGIVGGIGWMIFGFLTGSIAGILANFCFIGFNCHGFYCWKRRQEDREKDGARERT